MRGLRSIAAGVASSAMLLLAACSGGQGDTSPDINLDDDCTYVVAAVSSEKVNLFYDLASLFQETPEAKNFGCLQIAPYDVSSGEAARLLKLGWPEDQTKAPKPAIWSPASSAWVAQVADAQGDALVPDPVSFAQTPVVMAMPESMARKLGWPSKELGLSDLRDLCLDPAGWGRYGGSASLWGSFKLGKTNPNTSTTGLNTLLMQAYAATGKTKNLSPKDVDKSIDFSRELESCVIHYGDTTGSVLQRMYDRGRNGQALNYVSAVALEETSVINYNLGNPTSRVVDEGEQLVPPSEKLVSIYPNEGSLVSDNPVVAIGSNAQFDWVTADQRKAADAFKRFVQGDEAQELLGEYGFRPADSSVTPTGLVTPQYGADPNFPKVLLEKPSVQTVSAAISSWEQIRKPSSVLLLMDVSGSMEDDAGTGRSRMAEAIDGAVGTLGHFRATDELGVWAFTTNDKGDILFAKLRDVTPLGGDIDTLGKEIKGLAPGGGTPLYDSIDIGYDYMYSRADTGRINAIVVLTDGDDKNSRLSFDQLRQKLRGPAERSDPLQVRVFPIVYGDANKAELAAIAEASGGLVFDASDPSKKLGDIFRKVMNNF